MFSWTKNLFSKNSPQNSPGKTIEVTQGTSEQQAEVRKHVLGMLQRGDSLDVRNKFEVSNLESGTRYYFTVMTNNAKKIKVCISSR